MRNFNYPSIEGVLLVYSMENNVFKIKRLFRRVYP